MIKILRSIVLFLVFISIISAFSLLKVDCLVGNKWIVFSDAAKYADIARALVANNSFSSLFSFWPPQTNEISTSFGTYSLPLYSVMLSLMFFLFGIGNNTVYILSISSFFASVYLVGKLIRSLFDKTLGLLASIVFLFSPVIIEYAKSGGTETTFIFEILLSLLLLSSKKKSTNFFGVITLILMYFTRPQAFIYIAGAILFWLLNNFEIKRALKYFGLVLLAGLAVDLLVLTPLDGKYFLYSILGRGSFSATTLGAGQASSDILRGTVSEFGITDFAKKVFYNLYNFYKLAPQIVNPYLLALFVIGLFVKSKTKLEFAFKWATVFMVIVTLLVTAASIPLFRYIHPVVPLIYIIAVNALVWIVSKIVGEIKDNRLKIIDNRFEITKKTLKYLLSSFFILVFVIGQTLGIILLDSRFERKTKNVDKPPVYVLMSWKLKEITGKDDLVLTNLDTWGSWYGERRTVWFPMEPSQINLGDGKVHFGAIYLTNYLIDDPNYLMGENWRGIFNDPKNIKDEYINSNYEFAGEYTFEPGENYERMEGKAVLLRKK